MSILTLPIILIFMENSGIYFIIPYILGVMVMVFVIKIVDVKLNKQLETKNITVRIMNKQQLYKGLFTSQYSITYSVICPFCGIYMELNYTNTSYVTKFSEQFPICFHYRYLRIFRNESGYAKFVNPKIVED
jgi:hypothetical protein